MFVRTPRACAISTNGSICYFLYDYQSEISVEVVAGFLKMAVDRYRIFPVHIVPVFVDPLIGSLALDFSNVLAVVTFQAEAQVQRVL